MIKRILFFQAAVLLLWLAANTAEAAFNLMVASCREKASAEAVVQELSRLNLNGFIVDHTIKGMGVWHRVYVGPFATKARAFDERKKLVQSGSFEEVLVVPVKERAKEGRAGATTEKDKGSSDAAEKSVPSPEQARAGEQPQAIEASPGLTKGFGLQIGAFTNLENARNYIQNIRKKGQPAYLATETRANNTPLYKVGIGPFAEKKEATAMLSELKATGFTGDFPIVEVVPDSEAPLLAEANPTPEPEASGANKEESSPAIDSGQEKAAETPSEGSGEENASVATSEGETTQESETQQTEYADVVPMTRALTPAEEKLVLLKPVFFQENILAAGDMIHVEIPGQKDMSQDYDLDPEGNIYIVIVGKVQAAGKSLSELSQIVQEKVRRFIGKGDQVEISLIRRMRYIRIRGGVRYPGWYRVDSEANFKEILDMSGGLLTDIDPSMIRLLRWKEDRFEEVVLSRKFDLQTNDVLVVPTPRVFKQKLDMGDLLYLRLPEERSAIEGGKSAASGGYALRQIQVEVDKNGFIHVPGHGHIYVNGLTTDDIERIISEGLPKYIGRTAKVTVTIIEKKHYIQVLGHVAKPGIYNISESATVQAALSAAGGAVDGAVMSEVTIHRAWGGKEGKVRVNLYQFTITGDARLLPPLHDNDVLFVPITAAFGAVKRTLSQWMPPEEKLDEGAKDKIRVFGAVWRPGVFEPSDQMNLMDAIIMASGNRDDADLGNVLLIRENKAFKYDISVLLNQKKTAPDKPPPAMPKIQPGDSIYVSYVEKAGYQKQDPKNQIRVIGAVWAPGTFDTQIPLNLLDALSLAHGMRDDALMDDVRIIRKDRVEKHDMNKLFADYERKRGFMPTVNPGDTVFVGYVEKESYQDTEPVYVVGEVRSPGSYELADGGMTVLQALALAGGLGEWADRDRITIIRMVNGKQENIRFNYDRAIEGKYPDMNIRLRKNDTIYVP